MRRILLPLALCTLALSGCLQGAAPSDVAVTLYPTRFLAEALAGEDLEVAVVGQSGAHHFEPGARDLDALRKTGHLLLWDPALESWSTTAVDSLGGNAPYVFEVMRLPEGETLITTGEEDAHADEDAHAEDGHGHDEGLPHDPHTWLDPLAMAASAGSLGTYLAGAFPAHADNITSRRDALVDSLHALHDAFEERLTGCAHDVIVTNHDAYGYLARRYGFHVQSLHGIEPGSEPTPQRIQDAIRTLRELGLPVLFVEEGTDPRVVEAVRSETGVAVRVLHTLESAPQDGTYLDAQQDNLAALVEALGCP